MTVDWNDPSLSNTKANVLGNMRSTIDQAAAMDYPSAVNLPLVGGTSGVIRLNRTSRKLEEWLSSAWHERTLSNIIGRDFSLASFNNSSIENTVYSETIVGGTLGTDRAVRLRASGYILNKVSALPEGVTFRLKFGSDVVIVDDLASGTVIPFNNAYVFDIDAILFADDNISAQRCTYTNIAYLTTSGPTTSAIVNANSYIAKGYSDAGQDSTIDKNILLTVQLSTASTDLSCSLSKAFVELI